MSEPVLSLPRELRRGHSRWNEPASCYVADARIAYPDPTGVGNADLTIRTGAIGNSVCDSANPCTVLVNDTDLSVAGANFLLPITFAN